MRAAVNKEPDPNLYNRPKDIPNKMTHKSRSKFHSILQKLTGYRENKLEHQNDLKASSSLSVSNIPENNKEKDPILKNQSSSINDERIKEDIPAFLRRQAN